MEDTPCIGGGHSHHQFGVNLVGFHTIIFTVIDSKLRNTFLGILFFKSQKPSAIGNHSNSKSLLSSV